MQIVKQFCTIYVKQKIKKYTAACESTSISLDIPQRPSDPVCVREREVCAVSLHYHRRIQAQDEEEISITGSGTDNQKLKA